ncbi:RodZ family helix-turn-helix domain-containing protein [Bacillus sp. B15-48]|uniref:RodZ domain-containing protein n=1 Tax=Bacillus sp. B15-48 TaxID=1548601 RepID=UPI00193FA48B|nr:DUF4115 domain-containing protein [Bacillus sp. B15-48]
MTELGERLKQEREAKGLSLNELQDMTKIQKRYLVGIEEGNYSMMPGKFYVRAFIKQYAEAVGLDPDEIFEQYKNDIPSTYSDDLPEQLSRVQSRKDISKNTSKVLDLFPKILIGIFVIGAVVLLWYWLVQNAEDKANEPITEENNPVNIEEPDNLGVDDENTEDPQSDRENTPAEDEDNQAADDLAKEEPTPSSQELTAVERSDNSTVYELKHAEAFELKVVSTGTAWVRINNGEGKTLFEGTLTENASETLDFTNETEAAIRIGSVPSTELYINGQKLDYATTENERIPHNISIRYTKSE